MRFIIVLLLILASLPAFSADLSIRDAWVRQPPPGASTTAGYFTINNTSDSSYWIIGARSPLYGNIELHQSVEDDGVYRMIRWRSFEVPAKGSLTLEPGSFHLMMFRQKDVLMEGDEVPVTLVLGNGNAIDVMAVVKRK